MSKEKRVVFTVAIGREAVRIAKVSLPYMRRYARRIDAAFFVLSKPLLRGSPTPHWEKFLAGSLLEGYDRLVYLDVDILVRERCPDIFSHVPADTLGLYNEGRVMDRADSLREALHLYRRPRFSGWDGSYFNTGVMVVPSLHRRLFALPKRMLSMGMYEQSFLNARILSGRYPVTELDASWNTMRVPGASIWRRRARAHIVHYAGFAYHGEDVVSCMRKDLTRWRRSPR
jgi:alpha-N-acetylglucosamine transferase